MLRWFRRHRQAKQLAQADAEALIRDHGGAALGRLWAASALFVMLASTPSCA
jgi:hypothetical protein